MKNPTAVDFLIKKYSEEKCLSYFDFEEAKAIEKEQIIDAFNYARYRLGDSLEYYNETYGGGE